MTKKEYAQIADKVIGMLMSNQEDMAVTANTHLTMNNWEWPTGVALYSLYKVYEKSGEKKYLDMLVNWYDKKLAEPAPHHNVNTVAPVLALTCIYGVTKNEKYVPVINSWADWVMKEMPRTKYDGLQHMTVLNNHHEQLWDDTLFMAVLFLLKAGIIFNRKDWLEEAKYQFLIHIKYLQDKLTGLWYHGWTFDYKNNFAAAFWARGNSWFTSGAVEFMDILGDREDAVYKFVLSSWQDQVKELRKFQGLNGLFNTLLDDETSYTETSATAGIAYGVKKGLRMGLLDDSYNDMADKAIAAVVSKIDADGTVQGVSYGTGMGHDKQFYKDIKVCPTAYGQGLAFLMLTELI